MTTTTTPHPSRPTEDLGNDRQHRRGRAAHRVRPVRACPVQAGRREPLIVGLSADLAKYTDMHIFAQHHPERFFQMGMAEALMLGAAAGWPRTG